jgi:hypothetical protein
MVQEHAKKLASAAKKGSGIMLQLDPYACDMNREQLEGCGVGSKMKAGFKKLGSFVKGNKEAFRPLATSLKQAGREAIADATMAALDAGVDPSLVAAYSQLAQEAIPTGVQGGSMKSFSKGVTKFVRGPAAKTVRKAFRPLAQQAFEDLQDAAFQGLDMASQQALGSMSGQGVKSFAKAKKSLSGMGTTPEQREAQKKSMMANQKATIAKAKKYGLLGGALLPAGMGFMSMY